MPTSKNLAAFVGPVLVAITVSEALNIRIFATNTAPVVYLNGTILFAAGFAIVRIHPRWKPDWTSAVTLTGWLLVLLGLSRMLMPEAQMLAPRSAIWAGIAVVLALGCFLTFKGYGRGTTA